MINSREVSYVNAFLEKFIPKRIESAEEYPFPQYSDNPEHVFSNAYDLITHLEKSEMDSYSVYWRSLDNLNEIKHGMVFYTDDGKMIFGASIPGRDPEDVVAGLIFEKIRMFTGADVCCMTVEEAPPSNSTEFELFCKRRFRPDKRKFHG